MHRSPKFPNRIVALAAAASVIAVGVAAGALAAGGAHSSRAKIRIGCPQAVRTGRRVNCRVFGRLPHGPRGPAGARGAKGAKGNNGARGPAGDPGLSGYEVVSNTFKEVFVVNSGGQRGLSEVKTVTCPGGKRVIGGGTDLGTNESQNGPQRQVTVSLSGPNGNGTGWSAQLFNNSTSIDISIDLKIYAVCAKVG